MNGDRRSRVTPRANTNAATLLTAVLLSGCAATGIVEQGRAVNAFAQANFGAAAQWQQTAAQQADARQRAERMLSQPLVREDAVVLALGLSPAFQALLADGAAVSAAAAQSGRLPNPVLTYERLARRESGMTELEISRLLSWSILELFTLPSRLKTAEALQTQTRLRSFNAVIETATNARQAWVRAVAAQQALTYHEQVMAAAEASAELARRMYVVGNFSKLQRARQQAFYADAAVQLAQARQAAVASREALVRALGLDAGLAARLTLPARLPDLPAAPRAAPTVMRAALDQRLDVKIATAELDVLAAKSGFSGATSFINSLHLAAVANSESGKPRQRGVEFEVALPLFDGGDAARAQQHANTLAAMRRTQQVVIDAGSNVREQYAAYRTAWDLSDHYRMEIVPLRKAIADEMQLKYNGMLASVFDLLAETRAQIGSVIQAIDAQRDFWLADAALDATLLGRPMPMSAPMMATRVEAAADRH